MKSKMTLMPHQKNILVDTSDFNRVAYYLDMGLGKTFVGSEKAMQYTNQILVVCQKSKVDDWVEHFKKYYDVSVSDLTSKKPDYTARVLVINYDIVWRREILHKLSDLTIILDESSCIKNEKTKRTKIFLGSKRPKITPLNFTNVILLSGTPTGGKYEELVTQANLLGWDITKDDYWDKFINYFLMNTGGPWPAKIVKGYKKVGLLKRELRDHGAVFMKTEEVMTLPDQTDVIHKIKNHKLYDTFQKDLVLSIGDKDLIGDTMLTEMLYLRQLASQYNPNKSAYLKDMVESTSGRLIIFYNFTKEFDEIVKIAKSLNRPISIINGETKDLKNYETKDNSITILQYKAGAMGLNLQKASTTIYYSQPLSSELYEQSKKRTHRIGQNHPCFYHILQTQDSIEERIAEVLVTRNDYTNELFKGRST